MFQKLTYELGVGEFTQIGLHINFSFIQGPDDVFYVQLNWSHVNIILTRPVISDISTSAPVLITNVPYGILIWYTTGFKNKVTFVFAIYLFIFIALAI